MRRIVLTLALVFVSVMLLAQTASATELAGKWGVGVRSNTLGIRNFFTNNFAADVYFSWWGGTMTGEPDSHETGLAVAGMYVMEIYDRTLLEIGATLQGWQGNDANGDYKGWGISPFVGAEYLIGDHFGLDFKIFIGAYSSDTQGDFKFTNLNIFNGSLGAHVYF